METVKPALMKLSDAATYLATTEAHVRRLMNLRQIPFVKVGRLVRFRQTEIDAWVDDNAVVIVRPHR